MSVALDSVVETQAAQLNLLLYQIYRPYFNADPELIGGDTLTCGVCQKDFALADIVKFIQHKVLTCNKENYQCKTSENGTGGNSGESDVEGATNNNNNNNSTNNNNNVVTSPITLQRRKSQENNKSDLDKSTSSEDDENKDKDINVDGNAAADSSNSHVKSESLDLSDSNSVCKKRKTDCVDADTNTVVTGRLTLKERCSTR